MQICLFLDMRLLTLLKCTLAAFFNAEEETSMQCIIKSLLGNVLQVRSNYSTWILSTQVIQLGWILIIVKNLNFCHLCIHLKLMEVLWCICNMCLMSDIIYIVYCRKVVIIAADLIMAKYPESYLIEIEI